MLEAAGLCIVLNIFKSPHGWHTSALGNSALRLFPALQKLSLPPKETFIELRASLAEGLEANEICKRRNVWPPTEGIERSIRIFSKAGAVPPAGSSGGASAGKDTTRLSAKAK